MFFWPNDLTPAIQSASYSSNTYRLELIIYLPFQDEPEITGSLTTVAHSDFVAINVLVLASA
jgi:hypothetical protein